jgi:hypothetical protein
MHSEDYIREKTGLLLVDPYNDFLSPTGKLWPQAKEVAEEEFKPFDPRALARRCSVEEVTQDLLMLTAKREVCS